MALKGVLRPGYIQIRVLDMDAAIKHYVDHVGSTRSAVSLTAAFIFGLGRVRPPQRILRRADMPGMDYVGFKVASDADLDSFHQRIEEFGTKVQEISAGEQPGLGRRLSFVVRPVTGSNCFRDGAVR